MLIAFLVVEIIQRWIWSFATPLWPCINVNVIEMSIICHASVYRHAKIECCSLNIVRDITIKLQMNNLLSLRCSCDLEQRLRSSDWQRPLAGLLSSQQTGWALLVNSFWNVGTMMVFTIKICVTCNAGQGQYHEHEMHSRVWGTHRINRWREGQPRR